MSRYGYPRTDYLRSRPIRWGTYGVLNFGKYRGERIIDIMKFDIGWIEWQMDHNDWFDLTGRAKELYNIYKRRNI